MPVSPFPSEGERAAADEACDRDARDLPTDHAARVRKMFDALAPRYDLFNDVLSAGIHRRWRRAAADILAPSRAGAYLDLCAGTLDLARLISVRAPDALVLGADFSLPMLTRGREKAGGAVRPLASDALALPFRPGAFAGLTIAFGLRNLADREAGFAEMRRVLASGGRLVVLEFTTPPGRAFRAAYHAYFHHVLPRIGAWIAADRETSRYLPDSVSRFPDVLALAEEMRAAGFAEVRWRRLTGGIAALHSGVRR